MIFQVSIFNPQGKLKKRISSKILRGRHWQNFEENEVKRRKNFTKAAISVDCQTLLREFRSLNNLCDELQTSNGRIL